MLASTITTRSSNARDIPRLTHAEAKGLAETTFQRVLAVVETLDGDDWAQPTDCTDWTVQDMVAHLAGSCAASASRAEFFHQFVRNPYMREVDNPVDAVNRVQVEDRADKTPAELVEELREVGPKAIRNRQRMPWLVRAIRLPLGELGFARLDYLLDNIYTRDQWIHRVDLCRATGKRIHMTPEHDGRIIALVLRDLERKLRRTYPHTIDLVLTGDIQLEYRFGRGTQPDATLEMDVITFNRRASGRLPADEAFAQAHVSGSEKAAQDFLEQANVPY